MKETTSALEAYRNAFHCGVGGHDGHLEGDTSYLAEVSNERCTLAVAWSQLRAAMKAIESIKNKPNGGDWDEIEEARAIATRALAETE